MIMINAKWEGHKRILDIFKESKYDVLRSFYITVKSFIFTKKNNSKDILKYINENGKRVSKNQIPKECVEIMTFARNTTKGNEIAISHYNKDSNINIEVDKSLSFKEENGKVNGELSLKNRKYNFEIKDGKISKFGEEKQLESNIKSSKTREKI